VCEKLFARGGSRRRQGIREAENRDSEIRSPASQRLEDDSDGSTQHHHTERDAAVAVPRAEAVAIGGAAVGRAAAQPPPRGTRPEPAAGPTGSSPPPNVASYQSAHHSETFPCMSNKPHGLGFFSATLCSLPPGPIFYSWRPSRQRELLFLS